MLGSPHLMLANAGCDNDIVLNGIRQFRKSGHDGLWFDESVRALFFVIPR
jgi:hypothetical protein